MTDLNFSVQFESSPAHNSAIDAGLLQASRADGSGFLRVFTAPGNLVSLGRYHFAPPPFDAGTQLTRRLSGGRAIAFGTGFVGISLILPNASALVSNDPGALAPHLIGNRYVRGVLDALHGARVPSPFYPGRDLILAGGKTIGILSYDIDPEGALLFQVILAVDDDFSVTAMRLDAIDPGGCVKLQMIPPAEATCINRLTAVALGLDELADLIRTGFERQFGISCSPTAALDLDHASASSFGMAWLMSRQPLANSRRAVASSQLGVVEVQMTVDSHEAIDQISVGGDLIASSRTIEDLEARLRSMPLVGSRVRTVITEVLATPGNFILGANADLIHDLILQAS